MSAWIRFQFDSGETTLVNAAQAHFVFNPQEKRIEVHANQSLDKDKPAPVICLFVCETSEQVAAAEELVFDHLSRDQSLTLNMDVLDSHAEYLNHVTGLRMILQLLHNGSMRIPLEGEFPEQEMLAQDDEAYGSTEISQFENMLTTYLEVPADSLRRAFRKEVGDIPFEVAMDHEECQDHGFHEYWVVRTRPDRNYRFRDSYHDLAVDLIEKDGYQLGSNAVV